jgi:hypothetical protein
MSIRQSCFISTKSRYQIILLYILILGAQAVHSVKLLGYGLNVESWFNSWPDIRFFLFSKVSRPAMGPTEPSTQGVTGTLTLEVKWLGLQDDHSPQSTTSLRMFGAITSTPLHASLVWTVTTLPFDHKVVSRLNTAVVKPNNNKYYRICSASNIIMYHFHGVSWCLQTTQAWHL